jgi:hypothetical protein
MGNQHLCSHPKTSPVKHRAALGSYEAVVVRGGIKVVIGRQQMDSQSRVSTGQEELAEKGKGASQGCQPKENQMLVMPCLALSATVSHVR